MKKISMLLVFVMAVSLLLPCILNTDAYALDKIYCPQCGNQISADSRFCMFCGAEIPAIGSSSAAAETPAGTWAGLTGIEIGDRVFFGEYEQDNNYYNGKEKIEWIVIGRDGNNLKLLSRYALDRQPFNTDWVDITWERCTLREWLNETFLNTAFSYGEQRSILTTTVNADRNPDYKTDPGHGTMDKIFCLSVNEFENLPKSAKACAGTAYCYAEGARESKNGNCSWWLRTPGWYQKSAVDVDNNGVANHDERLYKGFNVNQRGHGVRPALWVEASSVG